MSDAPVCFVDTETLGLDADHHPIWEVGLILPDGTEHEWQVEVTPREIALADPKALEISGFFERYGKTIGVCSRFRLVRDLMDLIPPGCHLAGAVVSFDEERLRRLFWAQGQVPRWHYHLICCETLAVGYLVAHGVDVSLPWRSEEISTLLGVVVKSEERHTALGDARWARDLWTAVRDDALAGRPLVTTPLAADAPRATPGSDVASRTGAATAAGS